MEKKGGGTTLFGSKSWQRRFFVCQDGMLTYYLQEGDAGQKSPLKDAIYRLDGCEVVKGKVEFGFNLVPQTPTAGPKMLQLRCETAEEEKAWMDTMISSGLLGRGGGEAR